MGSNGGAGAVSGRPAFRSVPIWRRWRLASIRRRALMVPGVMPGGWCRWPVRAGGCQLSVSEGEGGARGAEHTRTWAAWAWMAVPGTGSRRQAGRAGWKKEGGGGAGGAGRAAGTAAVAGHTRGPGGVGPMREIISKGFTHVPSKSPYHLPRPAPLCPFVPPDIPLVWHPHTSFPPALRSRP